MNTVTVSPEPKGFLFVKIEASLRRIAAMVPSWLGTTIATCTAVALVVGISIGGQKLGTWSALPSSLYQLCNTFSTNGCPEPSTLATNVPSTAGTANSNTATDKTDSPVPSSSQSPSSDVRAKASVINLDYYVSTSGQDSYANNGSIDRPWATITYASQHIGPGAVVHVLPGMYVGQVRTSSYGSSQQPITYVSDEHWGAKIVSYGVDRAWQNTGSYIIIDGFDVTGYDNPGQPAANNIKIGIDNKGSYVTIRHNHIHDIAPAGCADVGGGAGIDVSNYSASNNVEDGNQIDHIGWPDCTWSYGIYHANPAGVIVNNILYMNGAGIHLWHAATGIQISNNLVFNNLISGIIIGAGDAPGGVVCDNMIVTNNISINNGGYGILPAGSLGTNNVYSNNILYGNASGSFRYVANQTDTHTLVVAPEFVFIAFANDGSGNYHAAANSVARDGGTTLGSPPTNDYDGLPRPVGSSIDIGPYETKVLKPLPPVRP